jgi:hypothetical protein
VSAVLDDQRSETVPVSDAPADQDRLKAEVGHPEDRFDALKERIQTQVVRRFATIEADFLALMWCIDRYRVAEVIPARMAKPGARATRGTLEGIYRRKGEYLSSVIALIVGNMTTSQLAPRSKVMGFSQQHQIDIAWPARDEVPLRDVLICCEAKLTGAPGYGDNPGRGAKDDWTNRRKELKFQATDLKLYRNSNETAIHHWDEWRRSAPPAVYAIWAARLRPKDSVQFMINEARTLTDTYSDGVGIYAFQENSAGTGYEPTPVPKDVASRVTSIDNVLGAIAARIKTIMAANNDQVPAPVKPEHEPGAQVTD